MRTDPSLEPTARPAFVGMYDRDGERVWFRQLLPKANGDVEVYVHATSGALSELALWSVDLLHERGCPAI